MQRLEYPSYILTNRCTLPEVFCEKGVLRNFAKFIGKHLCQSLFFNKIAGLARNFIKKETLVQVFFCKFCEISKNTLSHRTPLVAASGPKTISRIKYRQKLLWSNKIYCVLHYP